MGDYAEMADEGHFGPALGSGNWGLSILEGLQARLGDKQGDKVTFVQGCSGPIPVGHCGEQATLPAAVTGKRKNTLHAHDLTRHSHHPPPLSSLPTLPAAVTAAATAAATVLVLGLAVLILLLLLY
jgi:hypothetical protein